MFLIFLVILKKVIHVSILQLKKPKLIEVNFPVTFVRMELGLEPR